MLDIEDIRVHSENKSNIESIVRYLSILSDYTIIVISDKSAYGFNNIILFRKPFALNIHGKVQTGNVATDLQYKVARRLNKK